jgi:enoyl-CoA hydratase
MCGYHIPADPLELTESPVWAEALRRKIKAFPDSAKLTLDLLRRIDLEDLPKGIEQESLSFARLQDGPEHSAWLSRQSRIAEAPGQIHLTRHDHQINILIDRPQARGAIDRDMRDSLYEGFTVAALDPEVTRVSLRSVGKAFCVGADLSEFGTTRDPKIAHAIRMQTLPALAIIRCAHKFEAHVQGACIGSGLEMAAFAHRLTATRDAWFQLPELAMGLMPGAGGCVSVARRIGRRRAALMILSGKRINADTALGWGLIDAIIDE